MSPGASAGGLPVVAVPQGGVLALDLAGVVGWAYGHLHARVPWFGTWHLPVIGGEGARYAAFENELAPAMQRWCPSAMIIEAPLPLMALATHSSFRVAAQQLTLRGFALSEAYRGSCPYHEIDAATVRGEVLGQRHFAKNTVKREVLRGCYERGWRVPDHNAGDACLTWEWYRMRVGGRPPIDGPLWRGVA